MLYIVALLIAVYVGYKMIDTWYGFDIMEWVMGILMAVCVFIVCAFVVGMLAFLPDVKYELVESNNIYALKDNSNMEGSFFLGSGYIDEEQKYFFIKEQEGGKKMDSVSADQSILYEGARQTKVEEYKPVIKGKVAKFFFTSFSPRDPKYKLYIPKNSITTDYKVDME